MATRKTKNGDQEKLDDETIARVIKLLEDAQPITKKEACSILNIAYNTTRLSSILEKYKEKKSRERQKRAEKRGKPANPDEVKYVITEYLEGRDIESISKTIYRPTTFVKQVLETNSVPIRARSHDYFRPELVPEDAVRETFKIGEKVYSMRYDSLAEICDEVPHYDECVYRIWLIGERWQQYAYQPASELASLAHLKEAGVTV
jgi:hypothetical protein